MKIAILMCGGLSGVGMLPAHVKSRVHRLVDIEGELDAIIISSRYTLNKPQFFNESGFVQTEAATVAKYLKSLKVISIPIYLELGSTDTIGSSLFVRSMLENFNFKKLELLIISSDWHIKRTETIYKWAFLLTPIKLSPIKLNFLSVSDIKSAQRDKIEKASLSRFKKEWKGIMTVERAWKKLFTEHDNYNLVNNSAKLLSDKELY